MAQQSMVVDKHGASCEEMWVGSLRQWGRQVAGGGFCGQLVLIQSIYWWLYVLYSLCMCTGSEGRLQGVHIPCVIGLNKAAHRLCYRSLPLVSRAVTCWERCERLLYVLDR